MARAALVALLLAANAVGQEAPVPAGAVRVGSPRLRHLGRVVALACSPNGKLIATFGDAEIICVFDATSGKQANVFTTAAPVQLQLNERNIEFSGGTSILTALLRFSPDNSRVFVGSHSGITTYSVKGDRLVSHAFQPGERCIALSGDGTAALMNTKTSTLRLLDAEGRRKGEMQKLPDPSRTTRSFEPGSGEQLTWQRETELGSHTEFTKHGLLIGGKFVVLLIDTTTGKLIREWTWMKAGDLTAVALSPDGATLAAVATRNAERPDVSTSSLIRVDMKTGGERVVRDDIPSGGIAAFSPDMRTLALMGREGLLLIDVATGRTRETITPVPNVTSLCFAADGRSIAGVSDSVVIQWDVATGRRLTASADPAGDLHRLRFLDSRRLLVFAGEIVEYDWRKNEILKRYPAPPHTQPAGDDLSPDGKTLAVCDKGAVRLVDAASGRTLQRLTGSGWGGTGRCAFGPDGKRLLFLGANDGCRAFDLATSKSGPLVALEANQPGQALESPAASPDGRFIAGNSTFEPFGENQENRIRLYDGRTGAKLRDLSMVDPPNGTPTFSADGRRLAVITAGSQVLTDRDEALTSVQTSRCVVWDPATGKVLRELTVPAGASSLVLSPDGRTLACSGQGGVAVIEIATGVERARFVGHQSNVESIAFSPCGRYLGSASSDAPIYVWELCAPPTGPTPPPAALWADLVRDGTSAVAMRRLIAAPDAAVTLFRERIPPVAPVAEERLRKLLEALDHPRYAERSQAAAELRRITDQAEAMLVKLAVLPTTSAHVRRQVRWLLDHSEEPNADLIARLRALEVLERIATPAAKALIGEWANGAPAARFTQEARAALARLR
jgi:WD40 repeat protein